MLHSYFNSIVSEFFSTSLMIGGILLFSRYIDKKYRPEMKLVIWCFILLRLIAPYSMTVPNAPVTIPLDNSVLALQRSVLFPEATPSGVSFSAVEPLHMNPMSPFNLLFIIWIVGALITTITALFSYLLTIRNYRRWYRSVPEKYLAVLEGVRRSLGIKSSIKLMHCQLVKSPMMFSIISPAILLPEQAYSEEDLRLILKHELIHLKRHHLLIKFTAFTAKIIHWFNPLVYLMVSDIDETLEMSCDAQVVRDERPDAQRRYMETIIDALPVKAARNHPLTTQFNGGIKSMKTRLKNIIDNQKKQFGLMPLFALLTLMIMTLSLVACGHEEALPTPETHSASTEPTPLDQVVSEETSSPQESTDANSVQSEGLTDDSDILGPSITGIASETEPYPELEKTIIDTLDIPEEFFDKTQYYYNYVDLNDDSVSELFVLVMGPYTSGSGGSTAMHILVHDSELTVNQVFTLFREPIIISDHKTKGLKDIIVYRSGGGAEGSYVTLTSTEGTYQSVNEGTVIDSLEDVSGIAIMNNDILKDREDGIALYLGH